MQAVISGRAGAALLIDGEDWTSLHSGDLAEAVSRKPGDFPFLFGDAHDLQFLEDVDRKKVTEELELACDRESSLHLALFILDADLPSDVREEAASELDTLLKKDRTADYLESILYAQPMPESADITGATQACRGSSCELVAQLFQRLVDRQSAVCEVRLAWNHIPIQYFGTDEDRSRAEATFVREGLFRRLVVTVSAGGTVDGIVFACLNNPGVQGIPKSRRIVAEWVSPFREGSAAVSGRPAHAEEQSDAPERRSKPRRRSLDRKKVLETVGLKKLAIVEAMDCRDSVRVWNLVEELINYHSKYGGAEFACKSLCDLATEAKQRGLSRLQLELATRSVDLAPADGWSLRQLGDALLVNGKPKDALTVYDSAISIDGHEVAMKGRAETLKALGRLDEALEAFDAVLREHPEDAFAKNGRAETLKAQGRFDEALAAYDAAIRKYPEDVVAKTGRAETLKTWGRLDDALAAYDALIQEHPEDAFAKIGRAETLKARGQLDEALIAYDAVISAHSKNVVAKCGRAETFKALGRLDEALAAYEAVIREHPENVFAKTGRAEILKARGQLEEALAAYDAVIREHPEDVVAKNGRAEILKARGQLEEALAAYDAVIREHPENVVAKNGRAEILKARGQLEEALAAYDAVIREHPENVVAKTGRAEILKARGQLEEALAAYEDTMREHAEDQVARNGCACVLAVMKRWDEAKALVPTASPITEDQWIGYHIRGMILLRTGASNAACKIFEEGVQDCPYPTKMAYFKTALALARMNDARYEEAAQILSEVEFAQLRLQTGYLSVQVSGEMQRFEQAAEAYRNLPQSPIVPLRELQEELRIRYVDRVGRQQSDEWCFHRQVDAILLAA